MLHSPKVTALRESLVRALSSPPREWEEKRLHDEVCSVVEDLKAAGWPPERAIVAVKEIATEAGLEQSRNVLMLNRDLDARDALLVKVVRWCIECYYDTHQYA